MSRAKRLVRTLAEGQDPFAFAFFGSIIIAWGVPYLRTTLQEFHQQGTLRLVAILTGSCLYAAFWVYRSSCLIRRARLSGYLVAPYSLLVFSVGFAYHSHVFALGKASVAVFLCQTPLLLALWWSRGYRWWSKGSHQRSNK